MLSESVAEACEELGIPVKKQDGGPFGVRLVISGAQYIMKLADLGANLGDAQKYYRDVAGSVKILNDARLRVEGPIVRTSRTDVYEACEFLCIPAKFKEAEPLGVTVTIDGAALQRAAEKYGFALNVSPTVRLKDEWVRQ